MFRMSCAQKKLRVVIKHAHVDRYVCNSEHVRLPFSKVVRRIHSTSAPPFSSSDLQRQDKGIHLCAQSCAL